MIKSTLHWRSVSESVPFRVDVVRFIEFVLVCVVARSANTYSHIISREIVIRRAHDDDIL